MTSVLASVVSSNITENELSSLRIHSWITGLHSRHFRAIRGNPDDGGWREEILHLSSSAIEGHDLPTSIQLTTRYNGNSRGSGGKS